MISVQTFSLCLFVCASVSQSTECWTLTCPGPACLSLIVPVLCPKNENSYLESFCRYGGDPSKLRPQFGEGGAAQTMIGTKLDGLGENYVNSTMRTNMVLRSILFWPGCLACSPHHSCTIAAESAGLPICLMMDSEPMIASTTCTPNHS